MIGTFCSYVQSFFILKISKNILQLSIFSFFRNTTRKSEESSRIKRWYSACFVCPFIHMVVMIVHWSKRGFWEKRLDQQGIILMIARLIKNRWESMNLWWREKSDDNIRLYLEKAKSNFEYFGPKKIFNDWDLINYEHTQSSTDILRYL